MKLNEFKQKYSEKPGFNNILEFLIKNGYETKEIMFNFEQAKLKEQDWIKSLNTNNNKAIDGSTKKIKKFDNGFTIVQLINQASRDYEGTNMNHCVASYSDNAILYSLRDKNNKPHCTIEVLNNTIAQIKGFSNGKVSPKYVHYILSFLKQINLPVNSEDMQNLGYTQLNIELEKIIKLVFLNYKILTFDNISYIYTGNQFKLKNDIKYLDSRLFNYLCKYDQCRDCFKQLINIHLSDKSKNSVLWEINDDYLFELFEEATLAGNIFAMDCLYLIDKKNIKNEIDLFDLLRDCIAHNKPESIKFLLLNINKKVTKEQMDVLLFETIHYQYNNAMIDSLTIRMNQSQKKKFYQKAYNLLVKSDDAKPSLVQWLVDKGVKPITQLNSSIIYNEEYKSLLTLFIKHGINLTKKENKLIIFKIGLSNSDTEMIDFSINLGLNLSENEALEYDYLAFDKTGFVRDPSLIKYYLKSKIKI